MWEVVCQREILSARFSIDVFKCLVIGLPVFLPDFSECSELMRMLSLVHGGEK